jgi:hypothetical protein
LQLFPQAPEVSFQPPDTCPACGARLKVKKTGRRKVLSLALGRFTAHEWLCVCTGCGREGNAEELDPIVAPGNTIAYDVLVHVGREVFLNQRHVLQVRADLAARGLVISESEIRWLARRFLAFLAVAHRHATPGIKAAMAENGGYILHLDGTTDGQAPVLFCGMDGLLQIVLGTVKLTSEDADKIIPFLRRIKARFGIPLALVHDMGRGILKAVATVFPHVPDFICHFHFLRDAGNDLFGQEYDRIRRALRRHGVAARLARLMRSLQPNLDPKQLRRFATRIKHAQATAVPPTAPQTPAAAAYCLAAWVVDGKHQGGGYGLPFDRPHVEFLQRLRLVHAQLDSIKDLDLEHASRPFKPLHKLRGLLRPAATDPVLKRELVVSERKTRIFDELRHAMAIAPPQPPEGLNSAGANEPISTIRARVTRFCARHASDPHCQGLIAQIHKYGQKVFADPITVKTATGEITIQPQRTNNLMERRFRATRRDHRRRTGNNTMRGVIRSLPPDTMLVANLKSQRYMDILLDGYGSLEELFASLPRKEVAAEQRKNPDDCEKIPAPIREILDLPTLPTTVTAMLRAMH